MEDFMICGSYGQYRFKTREDWLHFTRQTIKAFKPIDWRSVRAELYSRAMTTPKLKRDDEHESIPDHAARCDRWRRHSANLLGILDRATEVI